MKLNKLFAFLIAFLLTGIVVTGAVGIVGTMRLGGMLSSVVDTDLVRFLLVTDVRKNIRSQLVLTKDYILASNDEERKKIEDSLAKAKKDSLAKLAEFEAMSSENDKVFLGQLKESYKDVLSDEQLVIEKTQSNDAKGAAVISKRAKGKPTWEEAIKSLITDADKHLKDEISSAKEFKSTSLWTIGATSLGALLLGLIVGGMIYSRISKNIATMISLQDDLKAANQGLELKVEERTRAINRILSNVRSGFLLIDRNLKIEDGFTKSCNQLFGQDIKVGLDLTAVLQLSGREKEHFIGCINQVFEDFLPEETSLGQTPQVFMFGDRALKLEGSAIRNSGQEVTEILFTVTDISKLMETEREIHLSKAIIKILQEREAFASFIVDTRKGIELARSLVASSDDKKLRMILHTIKGNSSAFGLTSVAHLIHEVEEKVVVSKDDLTKIESVIQQFLQQHATILKFAYHDDAENSHLTVPRERLQFIEKALENAPSTTIAVASFKAWMTELTKKPVRSLLGPVQDLVKGLGERLGKDVVLHITGGELLVDPDTSGPVVRNMIHVLRNSVDHGIEAAGERGSKDATGTVRIDFFEDSNFWGAKISDDGRGMDVNRIKKAAIDKGIITAEKASTLNPEQIRELLFAEGFSTTTTTTDISGRGVGMGAMRKAAEAAGGRFYIESAEAGVGSTFVIRVPKHANAKLKSRAPVAA